MMRFAFWRRWLVGGFCLWLALGGLAGAAAQTPAEAPAATLAELRRQLEEAMRDYDVPGAGIVLVSRDEVLWAAGLGVADRASGAPVTPDTRFRIGSISKTLIALSALQQQEAGRLSLDDPLSELAPEIAAENRWEAESPVLLSQLLEHTAGFDDLSLHDYGIEAPGISLRESLAETGESRVVRWRPGEAYLYSNVGPVAAAYAVERASGRPYAEYVRERIFEPLGMASATFALPPDVRASLATSYEADGITVLPATNPVDWPTGSISLAPRDLAPLIQLFLNRGSYRGQALLRPESIERMERPATALGARQGLAVGYGLGLEIMALDGRVFYGHSGAIDGFSSYLGYLPDAGLGYAVSISSANDEALVAMIGLIDSYLTRELPTPLAPPAAPIDPVRLEALAGYYELATPSSVSYTAVSQSVTGLQRVAYRDGALGVSGMLGTPKPLIPVGPALFRQETDPVATVAFAKDADGADRLQLKSRSLRRIPAWAAWSRIVGAVLALLGTLSSVLFALVWVPRWRFGGLRGAPHLSVRAWPLLAALCFAAILVQLLTIPESSYGYIARYGQPTVWSIGLFGLTLLFAGCALAGAVQVVRSRRWAIRRGVWLHSAIVSALMLLTLGYLASFGVIGVMTWR